ncbi:hypothetical protein K402DRAFT_403346 [Aulographum hederae CBS 113979]|uniref:Glycosyltransferase family 23 protein n=1 Tax=Aulographum hederae CBS 113979 TaxID=1176131 RepID=A0A6G1H3Q1_9PEZI|nr:hypothetical protein K402DRAFT_403346 [Aulographum hederae CBS 113979]
MISPKLHPSSAERSFHSRNRNNLSISSISSVPTSVSTGTHSPRLSPRISARQFLISNEPPSPNLPSLIPRHGKRTATFGLRQLQHILIACCALLFLSWIAFHELYSSESYLFKSNDGQNLEYDLVEGASLPDDPTAVIVTNNLGKARWTVSIPPQYRFPLHPAQYQEICLQAEQVSNQLMHLNKVTSLKSTRTYRQRSYYEPDPHYVDVSAAEAQGLLPHEAQAPLKDPHREKEHEESADGMPGCERSLTYVLETDDAGMGKTLLGLWMSHGLAQRENRAFFVDDTRWAYGNYSTYFQAPPNPGCARPYPHHIVPCPHSAAHLVVSAATFPETFSPAFHAAYRDKKASRDAVVQDKPLLDMLHVGYEALFRLADKDDREYAERRIKDLRQKAKKHDAVSDVNAKSEIEGTIVGLHIRRGDRHPWDPMYREDYLPLDKYMDQVRQILIDKYEHEEEDEAETEAEVEEEDQNLPSAPSDTPVPMGGDSSPLFREDRKPKPKRHSPPGFSSSLLLLASDDPDTYAAQEVSRALRAQDRIALASKAALLASHKAAGVKTSPYVDEVNGWEGGFYSDLFFGLGMPKNSHGKGGGAKVAGVGKEAYRLRELVGRAYLLDLEVLARSDAVVCAVSAAGCRVLGAMMGWERGFGREGVGWRNVDMGGERGWRWLDFQ